MDLASKVAEILSSGDARNAPENVREEWSEFFAEGIFSVLLSAFVRLSASAKSGEPASSSPSSPALLAVLRALGPALLHIPDKQLFEHQLEAKYFADDVDSSLPEPFLFLMNHLCPLLTSVDRPVKATAFHLLSR